MEIRLIEFGVEDRRRMNAFVRFHWDLYESDPYFCPDFNMEFLGNPLIGKKGVLRPNHPFHAHAHSRYWLAYLDNKIVGRVGVSIDKDYLDHWNEKTAHIGYYEAIDNQTVANQLLDAAVSWAVKQGMDNLYGPFNFSSHYTLGMQLHREDELPYFGTVRNPIYYNKQWETFGFKKAKDIIALKMDARRDEATEARHQRLERIVDKLREKHNISIRPVNLKNFHEEMKIMNELYNEAWSGNWGFVPLRQAEFMEIAENLKLVVDPGITHFAFINGQPAAFIVSIPDINAMIHPRGLLKRSDLNRVIRLFYNKKKVRRARLLLFGIKEKYRKIGLDTLLFYESFRGNVTDGIEKYEVAEISWLLEDNVLVIRAGESMGGKESRRWRIYGYPLSDNSVIT
jgi:hypothetical protein